MASRGLGMGTLLAKAAAPQTCLGGGIAWALPNMFDFAIIPDPSAHPSLLYEDRPHGQKSEGLWLTVASELRLQLLEGITGNLGSATPIGAVLSGGQVHLRPWTFSSRRRQGNRWPFIHRGQAQPHAGSHLAQAPALGAQLNADIRGWDHRLL